MNLPNASIKEINHLLGNIDIYLLDQILKGLFPRNYNILDAGCGEGRNLVYFIRNGFKVYGIDRNEDAIRMLRVLAKSINPDYPQNQFQSGDVTFMPYEDNKFDAIISSAVLHFSEDEVHFRNQISELTRVLKPGGILFARIATLIGIEQAAKPLESGKYLLPDGSVRFLLTKELLNELKSQFEFIEPFKVVMVENKRCMSTLVLKKPD